MSAKELQDWLGQDGNFVQSPSSLSPLHSHLNSLHTPLPTPISNPQTESAGAGWSKDDGSGETVGHDSGRKIVAILEKNPKKDPSKYDQDDIDHMRKVVAYCKRHLAQEEKAKKDTESKSYKSLKNWGHDAQKA